MNKLDDTAHCRVTETHGEQAVLPLAALILSALAMGASPIFVRLADVGPFASAFWRMALALPLLWAWLIWERQRSPAGHGGIAAKRDWKLIGGIGFLFAGDLFFWHLSIVNTSVANATLLATTTPIIVALGAWLFLKEYISARVLAGIVLGMAGAALLVGVNARFAPDRVFGDACGIITACFFGSYFLSVSHARRRMSAAEVMFFPALVTTALLFGVAVIMEDRLLPQSWQGLAILAALAFVSQLGGQGLAAYALGHLPAIFSSLVLFFEAIAAALLAWYLFAEPVSAWQIGGGVLILAGIYAARPGKKLKAQTLRSSP
ncbi:MAG: DMT family transporter [Hyphomicrobiales bacterium]|nr:DMT family transporter [Hyphomicrobiales bacterium]